ncbi:DUF5916 domain-containing protein [Lewinella sp. W8]|uniref:DUF5916 domain-containing protein n=1 Tax=Lewinella sp. W8 TaxID=2528208 RepID=UPI0010673D0A|nr:DUF5916 domain-containing protein [Lewinella sp. W8]MTB50039.1 hydrolase [Lewinella sp. W8]
MAKATTTFSTVFRSGNRVFSLALTGLFLALTQFTAPAFAQKTNALLPTKSVTAKFTEARIDIDGRLDESAWEEAIPAGDFSQYFPVDSLPTEFATEVRFLFNDNFLYVGIRAEAQSGKYVVSTLRRDFGGTTNDNVSLLFDTFGDGQNAYFFGVTPYGVQREGLVANGGSAFDNTWDARWQTAAERHDDHYTIEIAIPFFSLKFPDGGNRWRFRSYRWNLQNNEQSSWVRVPQEQILSSLAFMGELVFDRPLRKTRTPFYLIPYVNTLAARDFTAGEGTETDFDFGGDAKLSIGSGLNLDLTVNPDFSNVEVDAIFTNLSRFEFLLPERRQFFIDNGDLFNSFGSGRDAQPFFSRRIGLARDTSGALIENGIIGGARLSGKLDNNWRIGALSMQTASDEANGIVGNNNGMLALQRRVGKRSTLGAFVVNRQSFDDPETLNGRDPWNRVVGVDYDLASADNVWSGKAYLHKSFQPGDTEGNLSSQFFLNRTTRDWRFVLDFVYVNQDFTSDLGFIPRKDIFKTGQSITRYFYPRSGAVARHDIRALALNFWRPMLDMQRTDHDLRLTYTGNFRNQSVLDVTLQNQFIFLVNPFDPTRTPGATPLPGQQDYRFSSVEANYTSSPTQLFTYGASAGAGQFFTGQRFSVAGTIGLRIQPWAQLGLAVNYDGIRLPDPHADADLWLVSPRFDITFTKNLFWLTLVQYSNQRENLGINSRLQWRFAPLSDLFLVYNDNYRTTDSWSPRFRSINLKVTYWLNL